MTEGKTAIHDSGVGSSSPDSSRKPVLSLILCSRNDQYMGNSLWRLQTVLNYVAQNAHGLGREDDVELIVTDWGSDVPLPEVLELSPAAARTVSFVLVPPEVARDLQKDSPFPEVLALNAAARRVNGEYIGRIDQDTLVGKRFLRYFFDVYEGRRQLGVPLASALMFANQRMVPYRFSVRCPPLWAVDKYIAFFGPLLSIEVTTRKPFWAHCVGIWLLHRDVWNDCGGYDERMIHMDAMENDMIARLMKKYEMLDLGKLVGRDFYHLEHYNPRVPRRSGSPRRKNRWSPNPPAFHPNDEGWGLAEYSLEVRRYLRPETEINPATVQALHFRWLAFISLVVSSGLQAGVDRLLRSSRRPRLALCRFYRVWRHRPQVAWAKVRGEPLRSWPRLLKKLWDERWETKQGHN